MRFYIFRFFLFLPILLSVIHVDAQPVCPAIDAGPDVPLSCNTSCTNLVANYFHTGASSSYSVDSIAYAPLPFNGGTAIIIGVDDKWSGILPIPFNFCFFDSSYNQLVVGSNGVVSFQTSYANGFCPWILSALYTIPRNTTPLLPLNSILGPFQDIDPKNMGLINYSVSGTAPCRIFNVSFYQIPYYGDTNSAYTGACSVPQFATNQIILYETTNVIEINIKNKAVSTSTVCSPLSGWNGGRPY